MARCEAVDTFDDADFGYWDSSWGCSSHEVPCTNEATVYLEQEQFDQYVSPFIHLCAEHSKWINSPTAPTSLLLG